MKLAVLTYHPARILGNDPASNDLVAFSDDLRVISEGGWRVVSLREAIDAWLSAPEGRDNGERLVALTCDDGTDFDFRDLCDPTWGPQRGIWSRAHEAASQGMAVHVTSFVIASPAARQHLDRACLSGQGWMSDDWWSRAASSGLMHIANHSWDHNHEALPDEIAIATKRGDFKSIDNAMLADSEIRQAQEFLLGKAPGPGAGLFAYPYGDSNPYLVGNYLPANGPGMGLVAAFGTEPGVIGHGSDRWLLPRFVHARDWGTSGELAALLDRAFN